MRAVILREYSPLTMCQVSDVMCHDFFLTDWLAHWLTVCYQRGLRRLVKRPGEAEALFLLFDI